MDLQFNVAGLLEERAGANRIVELYAARIEQTDAPPTAIVEAYGAAASHTGDAFWMDEDGYLHFAARNDDMIVSSGYNIAGPEVEAALLSHPAVAECAVVGQPDEDRGSIVEAHVVLAPDHIPGEKTVKALQEHVKATIAPYKYPRSVKFVDALPKTESGKIQRFRLKNDG